MGRRTLLLIASILVAAIGTGLILLWVNGADQRAKGNEARVQVVIAKKLISQGTRVSDAKSQLLFDTEDIPSDTRPANALASLADLDAIGNQQAVGNISAKTMITTDSFTGQSQAAAPGLDNQHVAVQVQLSDPLRVAGLVAPGSKVAVIVTGKDGSTPKSEYLMTNVQVLRVGSTGQGVAAASPAETIGNQILTLRVTGRQALDLRFAEGNGGDLSLVYQGETNIPLSTKPVTSFEPIPEPTTT